MAMKLIGCLLAVALLGCLAGAQHQSWNPDNKQSHQNPTKSQKPSMPQKSQTSQMPTTGQKTQPPNKPPTTQKQYSTKKTQQTQNPQNSQYPQSSQQHDNSQVHVIPKVPDTFQSCEVTETQRVKCGAPGISEAECVAINCCYVGQSCFYGKFVTLQCTKDGQFIVVVARDATLPNIDLESISFLDSDPNCGPVGINSGFAVYQFPVSRCGTTMTEEPGVIIYENRMSSLYEVLLGPYGAITRDTQFDLSVQCRYVGATIEALVVEVSGLNSPYPVVAPGPLRVELRIANGACLVKGCVEAEVAYTSFYMDGDYPVVKVLREPVYVGVHILDRTDPNIILTLGRCWVTADMYPDSFPQWDLLVDGCPYRDDRYQTTLLPIEPSLGLEFPRHHRHFMFKMFTFVSVGATDTKKAPGDLMIPLTEKLYIHCETAVCQPTAGDNCEPRCFRKRREISSSVKRLYRKESNVVSSKEVIISTGTTQ